MLVAEDEGKLVGMATLKKKGPADLGDARCPGLQGQRHRCRLARGVHRLWVAPDLPSGNEPGNPLTSKPSLTPSSTCG